MATLYRAAGLQVYAKLGNSGRSVYCTSCRITSGLSVPSQCDLSVALGLGRGVDGNTTPVDLAELQKVFQPIEVILQVSEPGADGGVAPALAAGTYVLFKGYVVTCSIGHGTGSMSADLRCSSQLLKIGGSANAFSALVGTFGARQMNADPNSLRGTQSLSNKPTGGDIWPYFLKMVQAIFDASNIGQGAEAYLGDAYKPLKAVMEGSVALKSLEELTQSHLKYNGNFPEGVRVYALGALQSGVIDTGCLNILGGLAQTFLFDYIDLVDKMHLIPAWPFSGDPIEIAYGEYSNVMPVSQYTSTAAGTSMGSVPTAVGLRTAPQPSITISPDRANTSTVLVNGYYVYPGQEIPKEFAGVRFVPVPGYMNYPVEGTTVQKEFPTQYDKDGENSEPGGDPNKDRRKEALNAYAKFMTLQGLFLSNSVSLTTPLRDDIVPGACVKIVIDNQGDGEFHGQVSSILCAIDAGSQTANMTYDIRYVRNKQSQASIGSGSHHLFEDVASEIKGLSLWMRT